MAPKDQVFDLRPTGWENDPEEERFKVSTIDRTPTATYNQYVMFFRTDEAGKEKAVEVLKKGLEKTLSQARYMCSRIEPDPEGGHSFVKKKDSSVRLVVRRLDAPGDNYPSVDDIEAEHFAAHALGDLHTWSIPTMTWGVKDHAELDARPIVAGYQVNLARGGVVFSMHSHHYASDVMGWYNFTSQLADNCNAFANPGAVPFPAWDPARIDVTRFRFVKDLPESELVDGPPPAPTHPGHPAQEAVLFHLPKSKAAEIKRLAAPSEPGAWISTYDAFCAYVWRMLSRVREPMHKPALDQPLWWAEAVNMRPRLHDPPVPERMMRNIIAGAFSDAAPVPAPSAEEVLRTAPLSKLARYIRALTESCTEAHLRALIDMIAPVRDKRSISLKVDAHPPMSVFVTDHRPADVSVLDFGFARPITYRHVWGKDITAGLILVYAPIKSVKADEDEGPMFTVTLEKELVPKLRAMEEWSRFFEYRGVD